MSGVATDEAMRGPADGSPLPPLADLATTDEIVAVLQQLRTGMRCSPYQRTKLDAAIWAVRTVRATQAELRRVRLVVDELAAYDQLAGEADQLLAQARATGGPLGRRMGREAAVKATLAGAAAMAAVVQQGRETMASVTAHSDQLARLLEERGL